MKEGGGGMGIGGGGECYVTVYGFKEHWCKRNVSFKRSLFRHIFFFFLFFFQQDVKNLLM